MIEIERRFLVSKVPTNLNFEQIVEIEQYYLVVSEALSIRTRRWNDKYFLTIKSGKIDYRLEKEFEISHQDFLDLAKIAPNHYIKKTRKIVQIDNLKIEIDFFDANHRGLIIAEIEFASQQASQNFVPLSWFDKEITYDYRYSNMNLSLTQKIPE